VKIHSICNEVTRNPILSRIQPFGMKHRLGYRFFPTLLSPSSLLRSSIYARKRFWLQLMLVVLVVRIGWQNPKEAHEVASILTDIFMRGIFLPGGANGLDWLVVHKALIHWREYQSKRVGRDCIQSDRYPFSGNFYLSISTVLFQSHRISK
jgi:hypothetical protein